MAKFSRGTLIKCLTSLDDYERHSFTQYRVRGKDSLDSHVVTIDAGGLWTCDCKSARFRGACYHVELVKTEQNRYIYLGRLKPIEAAVIDIGTFDKYFKQERFIAERIYPGERSYMIFGKNIYLQTEKWPAVEFKNFQKFAGTILEGVWDHSNYRKRRHFYVFDCPFFKGQDLTRSPLYFRREKMEEVTRELDADIILPTPYAIMEEEKTNLVHGRHCILKDVMSPYDLTGHSIHSWMIAGRY